jgi:hypothetical protein
MKVSLVFDPDPDLGPDPLDEAKEPRSLGVFIDSRNSDVLILHRKFGDQYGDGVRTEVYASGVWEHLDMDGTLDRLLEVLDA